MPCGRGVITDVAACMLGDHLAAARSAAVVAHQTDVCRWFKCGAACTPEMLLRGGGTGRTAARSGSASARRPGTACCPRPTARYQPHFCTAFFVKSSQCHFVKSNLRFHRLW